MTSVAAFLAYVERVRSHPFVWGRHDCMTFANAAVTAYRGRGFADDWVNAYSTENEASSHAAALLLAMGAGNVVEAVDRRLDRSRSLIPPRASVVARPSDGVLGYGFGVMVSDRAAFVGPRGLVMLKVRPTDICWSVG